MVGKDKLQISMKEDSYKQLVLNSYEGPSENSLEIPKEIIKSEECDKEYQIECSIGKVDILTK